MMGSIRLVHFLICLIVAGAAVAQDGPVTIEVAGKKYDAAGLKTLVPTEAELAAAAKIEDQAVNGAVLKALDAKTKALEAAIELLERLARHTARKEEIKNELAAAKAERSAAEKAAANPVVPADIDETKISELAGADETARQAIAGAQGTVKARESAISSLKAAGEKSVATTQRLQKAREPLQAERAKEGLARERAQELDALLVANEVEQRVAEVQRIHQARFLEIAQLELDLAKEEVEVARARSAAATALLTAARAQNEKLLAAAKKAADAEAARRKRDAERQTQPAFKAAGGLGVMAQEFKSTEKEEATLQSRTSTSENNLKKISEDVARHNERLFARLPKNVDLDEASRRYLREQIARLERDQAVFEDRRRRSAFLTDARRTAIDRRERLRSLKSRLEEERANPTDVPLDESFLSQDEARWVRLRLELKNGLTELTEDGAADAERLWKAAETELEKHIDDRLGFLTKIESETASAMQSLGAIGTLLEQRATWLTDISFWLRDTPPLSLLSDVPGELAELPERTRDVAERTAEYIKRQGLGPVGWSSLGLMVLGLITGFVTVRRRQPAAASSETREEAPAPAAPQVKGILASGAAPALLLGGAALLCLVALPGAPLLRTALALAFVLSGWRVLILVAQTAGEYRSDLDARAVRRARRLVHLVFAALTVLVPIWVLATQVGATATEGVLRLAVTLVGLGGAFVLTMRTEIFAVFLPTTENKSLARVGQVLMRIAWPALVLFLIGVFVLDVMGYRNASSYIAVRSLACIGLLAVIALTYQLLKLLVHSRTTPPEKAPGQPTAEAEATEQRLLVARHVFGIVLLTSSLVAAVMAVALTLGITNERWESIGAIEILPGAQDSPGTTLRDLGIGALFVVIGVVAARLVREFLQLGLRRGKLVEQGARYAISTLSYYTILILGAVFGLRFIGIDATKLGWLLAPAGVALGFGLTEILSNFVSGLILFIERPVQVGDIITVGNVEGDVKKISIRATVVRTRDGVSIIIPNKSLITQDVVNWSHADQRTRLRVPASAAYGSDVDLIQKTLLKIANAERRILSYPPPEVQFKAFGESELQFELLGWLATPDITHRRRTLSDVNAAIDAAFKENGIEIPFPQRDLHLRTTPKDHRPRDIEGGGAEEAPAQS